jgi:phospho-N-acetylmuramoyl-pentapeptide-transferase
LAVPDAVIDGLLLSLGSAALVLALTPPATRGLAWLGAGKQIREEGPASHQKKAGTPTLGGLIFMGIVAVLGTAFLSSGDPGTIQALLALILATAALGAVDDLLSSARFRRGGLKARTKLAWQGGIALGAVVLLVVGPGLPAQHLPGIGPVAMPWLVAPLGVLAIVASGHAVNLTDGLDGLAGGTSLVAYVTFAAIAYSQGQQAVGALCLIVAGALVGFLWYNVHPARLFMGDTGSLALGSLLGGVALSTGQIVALIPIGGVFAVVTLSVILQVAYFKRTGGKRLFRMAPLQHHFELIGWPETQIVMRFWLGGALCAALGLLVAFL